MLEPDLFIIVVSSTSTTYVVLLASSEGTRGGVGRWHRLGHEWSSNRRHGDAAGLRQRRGHGRSRTGSIGSCGRQMAHHRLKRFEKVSRLTF